MTADELAAARALVDAATPGHVASGEYYSHPDDDDPRIDQTTRGWWKSGHHGQPPPRAVAELGGETLRLFYEEDLAVTTALFKSEADMKLWEFAANSTRRLLDEIDRLRAERDAMRLTDAEREDVSRLRDQTMAYGRHPKALSVLDKLLGAKP